MKSIIRWRLLIGELLVITILISTGISFYRSTHEFGIIRVQVKKTRDVLDALQSFLSCALDAETEERGYLLTGDDEYLEPYNRAASQIDARLNRVETLLANEPSRQSALAELRNRTGADMKELYLGIELRHEHALSASRVAILVGTSKQEMDSTIALVTSLQQVEIQSLDHGGQRYEAAIVQRGRLFATAVAIQLALLVLLFVVIYRDSAYRARAALEVLQGNLRLSAILKTMGEGLYQVDRNGKLVYLNPTGEKLLGYKKDEILDQSMHELIHLQDGSENPCTSEGCPLATFPLAGTSYHRSNGHFLRKNGSFVSVEYTCSPLIQYGESRGAVVLFRDITERNRMVQTLRDSEERYRNLVEKSRGLICTHDMEGTLLTVNEASAETLGYRPEELKGKNLRELLAPSFRDRFDWYLKAISEWGAHSGLMRVVTKDGNEVVWSYSNRVIQDPGATRYVLGHAHDVTAQILAKQTLKSSEGKLQAALEVEKNNSRVDFLTNIPNRRTFHEALESEGQRSRRYRRPMTLAYIDVDNFKSVNDICGHAAGDDLLKLVASTIQTAIRSTDTVARLGGDEFVLLLPDSGSKAAAIVAAKLRALLQQAVKGHSLPVSFSVGVVTFMTPLESVDDMIKRADELMYKVKRSGKGAVVCEVV
jgi:diguanylate cyclase (GGDEF)-like protein/PAS domain S-box-containing protein